MDRLSPLSSSSVAVVLVTVESATGGPHFPVEVWSGPTPPDHAWQTCQCRPTPAARQSSRRSEAQRVSSWRLESCSLRSIEDMWVSTVLMEMNSSRATSL